MILWFHVSILVWFLHAFSRVPSASYYNYCKIRNRNSLKCAFLIDQQFVCHFVLPGKNAVFQPPLENFQTRQTMCDTLFVRFSNMAINVSYTSFTLQEDFITANTFGDILYENFLFDIPKIMDICTLYGGKNSANTLLLRKMLDNIFSKQPK